MLRVILCFLFMSQVSLAYAETVRIPLRGGAEQGYYRALLESIFKGARYEARWLSLPEMPNKRADAMLERGDLDIYWYIRTPLRDKRFLLVESPLTEGYMGRRILMTRPELLPRFAGVHTLAQLQQTGLTAVMGKDWADREIWLEAGLPVSEQMLVIADLYRQVASGARGSDYFPRGSIEVMAEQDFWSGLQVVPGLVLKYPGDFYFYVSPRKPQLRQWLQARLKAAEQSGLRHRLFMQYYGQALRELDMSQRHEIVLR